jgi:hypothetical protein
MMGPRGRERMVEEVTETAPEAVPVAPPRPRRRSAPRRAEVERSISAAMSALMSLTDFSRSMEGTETASESTFEHETPSLLLLGSDDARSHSMGTVDAYVSMLAERGEEPDAALRRRARAPVDASLARGNERLSSEIASRWLTSAYLGATIGARFRRHPPVITTETEGFFELQGEAYSHDAMGGIHFRGTSHIAISPTITSEADRRRIIVHEQLHYASWLGGGHVIRWGSGGGRRTVLGYSAWLHEGLTELHAQQLTRRRGYAPTYIAYRAETALAYSLQRIVGTERLRRAYLTGDFSEVRRIVDRRLGAGTFRTLAGMPNGYSALAFLRRRMDAAGVDHSAWSSPLVDVELVATTDIRRRGNPPTVARSRGNR